MLVKHAERQGIDLDLSDHRTLNDGRPSQLTPEIEAAMKMINRTSTMSTSGVTLMSACGPRPAVPIPMCWFPGPLSVQAAKAPRFLRIQSRTSEALFAISLARPSARALAQL